MSLPSRPRSWPFPLLAALLVVGLAADAHAEKSGVRPNVIDLPKGPGSISGLGEQFTPNLATGSTSYTVNLALPPGTRGFAPSLALAYDSGLGNGHLGIGWTLEVGGIQRQTDKGLPRYGANDRFLFNGQELVPVGGNVYRLKQEGAFLRFRRAATHWEADAPDGTVYRFGVSASARLEGPEGTFRWALEAMVDAWGNRIFYAYARDAAQLYLTQVDYNAREGAANNRVVLEYESRQDALTDFRAGFPVTTARRLKHVRMLSLGQPVRRYELAYEAGSIISRLASITQYGADDVTALPAISFTYTDFAPSGQAVRPVDNAPAFSLQNADTELVDFDGDSLPDLLHAELGAHRVAYNEGGRWGTAQQIEGSPAVQLSTSGVEVADMDGDGRADLVAKLSSGASDFSYFPNQGRGRWEAQRYFQDAPAFSFEDPSVRPLDIDGDGLTDVMQTTSSNYYYWRNNGDGTWDAPLTGAPLPGETVLFTDPSVRLADMNGDRLVDLVTVRPGNVGYWPNMGYGRWGARVALRGSPDAGADSARLQVSDLSGDGLADLWLASGTQVLLWLQRGDGAFEVSLPVLGAPEANPATTVVRAADMDGSGTVDIVWNTPAATPAWRYLDLVGGVRPHLLRTVSNGLGRVYTFDYTSSGALFQAAREAARPWATRLPVATQLLEHVTTSDSRGWKNTQRFEYRDGYYDGPTRQFRGFGRTLLTGEGSADEAPSVSLHDFDVGATDEARKGVRLVHEERTGDGVVLRRTTWGYAVRAYATGTDGRRVARAEPQWQRTEVVEGSAQPVHLLEEWTYDDFGNPLTHSNWGVVSADDLLAEGDERLTSSEYANDTDRWLLGRVTTQTVTDGRKQRVSASRAYYDGEPFVGLPLGQLGTQGALTRTETWVADDEWVQSTRQARDAYGLVTETLDGRGSRREVEYDVATHRFPVLERFFLEQGRSLTHGAQYDPVLGTMRASQDAAGRETQYAYDALLRLTAIAEPGDSLASPSAEFEYEAANPLSRIITRARATPGAPPSREHHAWYDGLGRELAVVHAAEDGRTVVSGLKRWGLRGQAVRDYNPFFSQGFALPEEPLQGAFISHRYDALGRATHTLLQDGTQTEARYGPMTVEHWDADDLSPTSPHRDTPRTERATALGIVEVTERLGTRPLVTRFVRDPLGRVVQVIDATGAVSRWAFDGRGLLTATEHPTSGTASFHYDEEGNLKQRIDARGARLEADYDALSRLSEERLVDANGTMGEVVRYHYDAPAPAFPGDAFAPGELTWVEDGAGEVHYRRDERERVVELARRVEGREWRLQRRFDGLDRPVEVIYPDGRSVSLLYDPRGLLTRIPGVIESIQYDAWGMERERLYANGVRTVTEYDAVKRVSSIHTQRGAVDLLHVTHQYGPSGNLLHVRDQREPAGAASASRDFTYDSLTRLSTAHSPTQDWSYEYDDVGNITHKSDVGAYRYLDGARTVHAGSTTYLFDAAGQLTARPGFDQAYDARGRLSSVHATSGGEVRWRYDYSGAPVVKDAEANGTSRRTVYIDPWLEERDGQLQAYVYAGRQRVARLVGADAAEAAAQGCAAASGRGVSQGLSALVAIAALAHFARRRRPLRHGVAAVVLLACAFTLSCGDGDGQEHPPAPAAVFFHEDHLGSTSLQTDAAGEVLSRAAYAPFGTQLTAVEEPYTFTGREFDVATGLYDFGARAYDPVLGRFLTPDPLPAGNPLVGVSSPQRLNRYAYAGNAPTVYVDPDGRNHQETSAYVANEICRGGRCSSSEWQLARAVHQEASGEAVLSGASLMGIPTSMDELNLQKLMRLGRLDFRKASQVLRDVKSGEFGSRIVARARARVEAAAKRVEPVGCKGAGCGLEAGPANTGPKLLGPGKVRPTNFKPGELDAHFSKHAGEWGAGNITKDAYLKRAQSLLEREPGGEILGHTRATNGDILRYNTRTNEFAVGAQDGTIRTLFRPKDGLNYWNTQVKP